MVKILWSLAWLVGTLAVGFQTTSWAQSVTTYVDRNPITIEETVKLVVKYNGGSPDGTPDLSGLAKDFDVLGTSQSSRTSIINGKMESSTEWVSTLAPKREGSIVIPPIPVGAEVSLPLTLKVLPAGQPGKTGQARDLFLDVQVQPKNPYVQSQVTVTMKLFHALSLREGSLDEPKAPDVLVQKLGEDRSYETVLDGRRYGVIERQYALFPQKSGKVTIPSLTFTGKVQDQQHRRSLFDDMMGNRPGLFGADPFGTLRTVRTRSESFTLTVQPIPSTIQGDTWLPAQEFILQESWLPESFEKEAKVGEPITRTITMVAKGLTGTQLPDLPVSDQPNVNVYPDQPKTETRVEDAMAIGIRQQKMAFVPTASGPLHLPEVRIPWWDSKTKQQRVAVLPSRIVNILPEPGSQITRSGEQPNSGTLAPVASGQQAKEESSGFDQGMVPGSGGGGSSSTVVMWQVIAGVLMVLWFGTGFGWWYNHRRVNPKKGGQTKDLVKANSLRYARHAFSQACHANNPKKAKEALLDWAGKKWSHHPPLGLQGVAQRLTDAEAKKAVWKLDRVLYSSEGGTWNGQDCNRVVSSAMEQCEQKSSGSSDGLPPLYLTEAS
ncbi:BatD family protein [Candidatus Nitronereus thalassa]|uniref:BatD family protein n=1 Tax=Candidatus Nitronereus thalassa TaxID=3020898 RepID=A0ABU3K979_9BACT|nr:BatD family protein [Candidatus Nitronereus thalassa]MDT7042945.1 BatD family protein [Candidatus Nitronereus thalassa]